MEENKDPNYQRVLQRFLRHMRPLTNSPDYQRSLTTGPGSSEPDWSAVHRGVADQIELDKFFREEMPPEAVGTLNSRDRLTTYELKWRVERLRIVSGRRLGPNRPARRYRKIEYMLALEVGAHPKKGVYGRLHGHVLLWNVLAPLEALAAAWRELNGIDDKNEPVLKPYRGDDWSVGYVLKTLGTDADLVTFSRNLGRSLHPNSDLRSRV